MLDVNAGIPLVDEPELLKAMLRTVQDAVDVPICIDSSVIEALEAGLSVYEGRALVNSVTAEDERLDEILPLVARHGAAVIGLANDETGIPETPEKRLECARKIVGAASDYGIAPEDVIIDPLAMTVGADTDAVTIDARDDQPDPRRARRQHVPRRVERLVRSPAAPRPQRRLPADGDGRRADERDHVDRRGVRAGGRARPICCSATTRGARAGSPRTGPARPRSQEAAADRMSRRRRSAGRLERDERARGRRRRPARPAALPARRRRGPRPERDAGLRRRELERDRDRLDLRRPRHLQEVQGADRLRRRARWRRSTRGRSRPTSCATAGGSPAARGARSDLVVEVPPLQTRPKAALVGVGRHVILRPSVQKRHLVLEEPTLEDQRSDLQRVLDAIDDLEPARVDRAAARRSAATLRRSHFDVTAVVCDDELIDVEPGDTTARRFAIAFDLGTTTVVATLLDLDSGQPAAVRSMLNRQQPFGADVITRISATMMDDRALGALRERAHETFAELTAEVLRRGGGRRRARSTRSPSAAT